MGYTVGVDDPMYYSQPWEYTAEVLGDVDRTMDGNPYPYYESTKDTWEGYMAFTIIVGIWFLTQVGK